VPKGATVSEWREDRPPKTEMYPWGAGGGKRRKSANSQPSLCGKRERATINSGMWGGKRRGEIGEGTGG